MSMNASALSVGQKAPAFTLPSKPGTPVDVGALYGQQPVVLLFMPLAFSGVCTTEVCTLRDGWSKWGGLGAQVFGITVDSPFATEKFRDTERIPFPILSDFNKSVSKSFGVLHEDLMGLHGVSKRSVFVIGRDGTVMYAWVTENPGVQIPFDDVMRALESAAQPA